MMKVSCCCWVHLCQDSDQLATCSGCDPESTSPRDSWDRLQLALKTARKAELENAKMEDQWRLHVIMNFLLLVLTFSLSVFLLQRWVAAGPHSARQLFQKWPHQQWHSWPQTNPHRTREAEGLWWGRAAQWRREGPWHPGGGCSWVHAERTSQNQTCEWVPGCSQTRVPSLWGHQCRSLQDSLWDPEDALHSMIPYHNHDYRLHCHRELTASSRCLSLMLSWVRLALSMRTSQWCERSEYWGRNVLEVTSAPLSISPIRSVIIIRLKHMAASLNKLWIMFQSLALLFNVSH